MILSSTIIYKGDLAEFTEESVVMPSSANDSSLCMKAHESSYSGCLGPDAPSSFRASVLSHDMDKLIDRVDETLGGSSSQLSECDFATLLHQVWV
jgi:hypothetical protein